MADSRRDDLEETASRALRLGAPLLVADDGPPPFWWQAKRPWPADRKELARVESQLRRSAAGLWRLGDWWADIAVPVSSGRVVRDVARLLTAVGPLSADLIVSAWDRRRRQQGYVPLPPPDVTAAWLGAHPDFTAAPDGPSGAAALWQVITPVELDPTTATLVEVLRSHPDGMTRAGLRAQCLQAGMNAATFAVASSYSPVLAHPARDTWTLVVQDPMTTLPARKPRRLRPKGPGTTWTWAPDGALVVSTVVTRPENLVVSIPAAVRPLVEGRQFTLDGEQGGRGRQVRVSGGLSWGYHRFLTEAGAETGDRLEVRFHLAAGSCDLRVTADVHTDKNAESFGANKGSW